MNIENIAIKDIKPYERNAKKHDERQIKNVMQSIKNYGIVQPLVVDKDNVLIIGHCRLIAAKRLKMKEVPVVRMDELTQEQVDLIARSIKEFGFRQNLVIDDNNSVVIGHGRLLAENCFLSTKKEEHYALCL